MAERAYLVVPDGNFYIHHPDKLEVADIGDRSRCGGTRAHVVVPLVVVDELDGLKRSSKRDVRWRAGYTVAVLDRVFEHGTLAWLARATPKPLARTDPVGQARSRWSCSSIHRAYTTAD